MLFGLKGMVVGCCWICGMIGFDSKGEVILFVFWVVDNRVWVFKVVVLVWDKCFEFGVLLVEVDIDLWGDGKVMDGVISIGCVFDVLFRLLEFWLLIWEVELLILIGNIVVVVL